jgi:hypothetical protein
VALGDSTLANAVTEERFMAVNSSTLGIRQVQQALQRGAKDVLVANGIQPSTRRGNKELDLAVQRLAQQTYSSLEEAAKTGEALGQKIVELSQAKGKTDLDGGIIRQMMLTGEIPTVVKVTTKPAKTSPVVVSTAPKAAAPAPAKPAAAEAKVEAAVAVEAHDPVELEAVEEDLAAEPPSEAIAPLEAEQLDPAEPDVIADEADVVTDEADVVADEVEVVVDEVEAVADEVEAVADEVEVVVDEVEVVVDEVEVVVDEVEVVVDEADVVADEVEAVVDDVMAAETVETVDPEMADAPDLEVIETLEPAAIAAPEPEPAIAADAAIETEADLDVVGAVQ